MMARARFLMIAPMPGVFGAVLAGWPGVLLFHDWTALRLVGLVLLLGGFALVTLARLQLGDAFTVTPKATVLVTRGLYSRIRNPIYTFGMFMVAGIALYWDQLWALLLLVPVGIGQALRAKSEAKVLKERFGDAYLTYRARTWF